MRDTFERWATLLWWLVGAAFLAAAWSSSAHADVFTQTAVEVYPSGATYTISVAVSYSFTPHDPAFPTNDGSAVTTTTYTIGGGPPGGSATWGWGGATFSSGDATLPNYHKGGANLGSTVTVGNLTGDPSGFTSFTITSTTGNHTLSGAQTPIVIPFNFNTGANLTEGSGVIPQQFYNSFGQFQVVAVQDGAVVGSQFMGIGNTSLTINTTTNTDPVQFDLVIPGYISDPNGGYIHTGNPNNTADVPFQVEQNGVISSVASPNSGAVTFIPPGALYTEFPTNQVSTSTSSGNNSNVGIMAPVGYSPIWTNPSLVNSSYNVTADPLSASIFKQGVTNLEVASQTSSAAMEATLGNIATNTANLSGNGGGGGGGGNVSVLGGNITANVDLAPVVNAVNGVNATIQPLGSLAASANSSFNSLPSSSQMVTNGNSISSQITALLPTDGNFDGTTAVSSGSPPTAFDIAFPAAFGGVTWHLNPFSNPDYASLFNWLRAAEAWLIVIFFGIWAYKDMNTCVGEFLSPSVRQVKSNDAPLGVGYPAVLANLVVIVPAILIAVVALVAMWETNGSALAYSTVRHLDPFTGLSADIFWFIDQTFPCKTAITALTIRLSWQVSRLPVRVAVFALHMAAST